MGNVSSKAITSFEEDATVGNRMKLKDWEARICPQPDCKKPMKDKDGLLKHSKAIYHLEPENLCHYCKAPFGAKGQKARGIHEIVDHPANSQQRAQKKQKKNHSGGKPKKS